MDALSKSYDYCNFAILISQDGMKLIEFVNNSFSTSIKSTLEKQSKEKRRINSRKYIEKNMRQKTTRKSVRKVVNNKPKVTGMKSRSQNPQQNRFYNHLTKSTDESQCLLPGPLWPVFDNGYTVLLGCTMPWPEASLVFPSSFVPQQEPKMKQLHSLVIPKVASKWKMIAEFLELDTSTINMIEGKRTNDPKICCEEVFREWLKTDSGLGPKTWSTLIETFKEIEQLKSFTEDLCHESDIDRLKRQDHTMTSKSETNSEHSTQELALKELTTTKCDIMDQKPKMKQLNNLVVPRIAANWKNVADSLEFQYWTIKNIEVKYRNYPEESCQELLRDWLSLDHGIGPKTWSTLLKALRETRSCAAVTEMIEYEVKMLPR